MSWYKCSSIIFLLVFSMIANANSRKFSSKECLDASFKTDVKNEGQYFGLIKNDLAVRKNQCLIEVEFTKIKKVFQKKWVVDICREPIHIKLSARGTQNVYKRIPKCSPGDQAEFCLNRNELLGVLQDYGLIFADGEKENIDVSHGQVYCSYLLLKRYLEDGILFSKYDNPMNIFDKNSKESCEIPQSNKTKPNSELKNMPNQVEQTSDTIDPEKAADAILEAETPQF